MCSLRQSFLLPCLLIRMSYQVLLLCVRNPGADYLRCSFFFITEKTGYPVHHLTYVGDGEFFHTSLYYTMARDFFTVLFDGYHCLSCVIRCHHRFCSILFWGCILWLRFFGVMSFSCFLFGFFWWWHLFYCFYCCFGEFCVEVAVYMVSNCWVYFFLCASHQWKNECFFSLIIYFGMKPTKK